ncbi:phosphomannomutase/phosphoglucomutase [Iodobacter fluviatilis]|uniref:Phosphomannomutase n=1 Tax=Iodobacter fluviatilis TaxID=537 RepID=A0A377Q481_9NEIS|nr:phosphomannomutase/phosphoglucomutase [Iodobacter fluviatilis]TCU84139.1 phosphomannomutase [Iodobacter fluviatilis]STQ89753.1 Phosphomannomutase/phosphoglucomutase [Iodobacter fluviatilis]
MPVISPRLFKAYDIRAQTSLLTPEAAHFIGLAIGAEAHLRGVKQIALARDGRFSSPALARALIDALLASGINVLDLGLAATPLLYFAARQYAAGSGVMITGSHNPADYNGIKITLAGETIDGEALQALRQRIEADDFIQGQGEHTSLHIAEAYYAAVLAACPLERRFKVVVDCGNGVPGAFAPDLYRALGCEVVELYCKVDGAFPNHHPDPQVEANLADLKRVVQEQQADIGLAFDGDGDRLGVVTRHGESIPGDRLLMLFAAALLEKQPGHVLYDVKSSGLISEWVSRQGGSCAAIPTGHGHMKRHMYASKALLAGELSGHFAFKDWPDDDALFAGARFLSMIAGRDLDQMLAALPQSVSTPELQVALEQDGHGLVADIAKNAVFPRALRIFTIDGLRIEYADGFGLIRASNTTPVLTLRMEAQTALGLARIQQELAAAIAPLVLPCYE